MAEWKKPHPNPKLPPSVRKIVEGLEATKAFLEQSLEADLKELDKAQDALRKMEKRLELVRKDERE